MISSNGFKKSHLDKLDNELINIERFIGGLIMGKYNPIEAHIDRKERISELYEIRMDKINEINDYIKLGKKSGEMKLTSPYDHTGEPYLIQRVIGIMGAEGIVDDSVLKFMSDFSKELGTNMKKEKYILFTICGGMVAKRYYLPYDTKIKTILSNPIEDQFNSYYFDPDEEMLSDSIHVLKYNENDTIGSLLSNMERPYNLLIVGKKFKCISKHFVDYCIDCENKMSKYK